MWAELLPALPTSVRAITLDLPGHGHSENLGYVHSMLDMAEVLRSLMRHLRLRKVFLVGHSMGGYVALAFAEAYPDLCRGIILLNSTAKADSPERRVNRDRAIELVKRDHHSYIRTAIPLLYAAENRTGLRAVIQATRQAALGTTQQGVIAALEGMKNRPDREVILHFAAFPVLLIAGKEDPVIPLASLQTMAQESGREIFVLSGGHMSHQECPEQLRQILQEQLRRLLP